MDLVHEVLAFSRDYVNGNQTSERKRKIAAVYKSLLGENLKIGCGTCYIEAIFKIKKKMESKPCSFRLKPGALLKTFGDETKTCTNANLTDELAEFHLRNNPGCIRLFSIPTESEIQRMFYEPQKELEIIIPNDDIDPAPEGVKKTRTRKPKK
jgi:hypothetical protein